jgi:hypothetical protein
MSRTARIRVVIGIGLAAAVVLLFVPAIPQPQDYHQFADQRAWLGIPNFANVASNIPFALAGIAGLIVLAVRRAPKDAITALFAAHFASQILVCFGSSYYHWTPNDATLFWDRLSVGRPDDGPSISVADRISERAGVAACVPAVLIGALSVVCWKVSGDLRVWGLVQFYSMAAIALAALVPGRFVRTADWLILVGWYAAAKVCELLDVPLYEALRGLSGHTLKHLIAAGGAFWLVRIAARRLLLGVDRDVQAHD